MGWRKKINGPLGICSNYVYKNNGKSRISVTVRNVSYKPIKAFKLQFVCCDVFGATVYNDGIYYVDSTYLSSGDSQTYYWDKYGNIDHIKNVRVTQVVYSDGQSWYR